MDLIAFIQNRFDLSDAFIRSSGELDKAINHIVQLIRDACCLYMNASYPNSVFLSITACEEVVKANLGCYVGEKKLDQKGRPLFKQHKTKHILSAMPTVAMGNRLQQAIGELEMRRIIGMATSGGFLQLRESALYFQRVNNSLVVPAEKIDRDLARTLILYSIEVFDDSLVGKTSHSIEVRSVTDELFEKIKST